MSLSQRGGRIGWPLWKTCPTSSHLPPPTPGSATDVPTSSQPYWGWPQPLVNYCFLPTGVWRGTSTTRHLPWVVHRPVRLSPYQTLPLPRRVIASSTPPLGITFLCWVGGRSGRPTRWIFHSERIVGGCSLPCPWWPLCPGHSQFIKCNRRCVSLLTLGNPSTGHTSAQSDM